MDTVGSRISIRRLRAEDTDAISEIYTLITLKAVTPDFKGVIREHACKSEHEASFAAELDGVVIGFMISYLLTLGFGAEKSAYVATMGVHPRYMGQGVGAKMAQEIFKFYRSQGITQVYSSVRWDSTDILSFFKKMDFDRSDFINLGKDLDDWETAPSSENRDACIEVAAERNPCDHVV